ncbi:MAG: HAD family phosphatase, partial [Oscillospiraceae bacterium]|nr:HAD family phosphatase [Oscillospiraceae bacterium]
MYRIIVSDLDETLLNADKSVSQETRAAIRAVRDMGVKFVPASGRGFRSMDKTLKELELYGRAG